MQRENNEHERTLPSKSRVVARLMVNKVADDHERSLESLGDSLI